MIFGSSEPVVRSGHLSSIGDPGNSGNIVYIDGAIARRTAREKTCKEFSHTGKELHARRMERMERLHADAVRHNLQKGHLFNHYTRELLTFIFSENEQLCLFARNHLVDLYKHHPQGTAYVIQAFLSCKSPAFGRIEAIDPAACTLVNLVTVFQQNRIGEKEWRREIGILLAALLGAEKEPVGGAGLGAVPADHATGERIGAEEPCNEKGRPGGMKFGRSRGSGTAFWRSLWRAISPFGRARPAPKSPEKPINVLNITASIGNES